MERNVSVIVEEKSEKKYPLIAIFVKFLGGGRDRNRVRTQDGLHAGQDWELAARDWWKNRF